MNLIKGRYEYREFNSYNNSQSSISFNFFLVMSQPSRARHLILQRLPYSVPAPLSFVSIVYFSLLIQKLLRGVLTSWILVLLHIYVAYFLCAWLYTLSFGFVAYRLPTKCCGVGNWRIKLPFQRLALCCTLTLHYFFTKRLGRRLVLCCTSISHHSFSTVALSN